MKRSDEEQELKRFADDNLMKIYSCRDNGINKLLQIVPIEINITEIKNAGDPIVDDFGDLVRITQIYKNIFSLHYAMIANNESFLVALRQPSQPIAAKQLDLSVVEQLEHDICQILVDFGVKFKIQVKPVIVKREGAYLVRFQIHKIVIKQFYAQTSYQLKPISQKYLKTIKLQASEKLTQAYDVMMKTVNKPHKMINEILKIYFQLSQTSDSNYIKQNIYFSLQTIRTKDNKGKFILPTDYFLQHLMFHCIFNPACQDFIYNPKSNIITFQNQSRYYNYYHFKHNITQLNKHKTNKSFFVNGVVKKYQRIPLTFDLTPEYQVQIIETPCRGQQCSHYSFYELRILYENQHKDTNGRQFFRCPICKSHIQQGAILIINNVKQILEMAKHHAKLNDNCLYEAFLNVNHQFNTVEYSFASDSINLETVQLNGFYEKLTSNESYNIYSNIQSLKRNRKFIKK